MASITGTNLLFPDGKTLEGHPGVEYVARMTYATTQLTVTGSNQYLNIEITMPPAKSSSSRYLLVAESKTDDTNSSTAGCGLSFWVETSGGGGPSNTYWVQRQGAHQTYFSYGADTYYVQNNWFIDTGSTSTAILAGQTRKYRLYGDANNGNIWFHTTNVGATLGWNGAMYVVELDGSLF